MVVDFRRPVDRAATRDVLVAHFQAAQTTIHDSELSYLCKWALIGLRTFQRVVVALARRHPGLWACCDSTISQTSKIDLTETPQLA